MPTFLFQYFGGLFIICILYGLLELIPNAGVRGALERLVGVILVIYLLLWCIPCFKLMLGRG